MLTQETIQSHTKGNHPREEIEDGIEVPHSMDPDGRANSSTWNQKRTYTYVYIV